MIKNATRFSDNAVRKQHQRNSIPALFTLTRWQLRSTWWILLLTGIALSAAFAIACIAPLFSAVADTAGLQGLFNGVPAHRTLALDVDANALSSASVENTYQQFDRVIRPDFSLYLEPSAARVITVSKIPIIEPASLDHVNPLNIYATSIERLKSALHLVQGHWASEQATDGTTLEIMLTASTAHSLGLSVGSTLTVQTGFLTQDSPYPVDPRNILHLRLVGLFTDPSPNTAALFGQTFQPLFFENGTEIYTLLVSDTAFLQACDYMASIEHSENISPSSAQGVFRLTWYYQLDTSKLEVSRIDELTGQLAQAQARVSNLPINGRPSFPYVRDSQFSNSPSGDTNILSLLRQYTSRIAVVHLPILLLALQVSALLLFFACLLTHLLIDRQTVMNALLSSRGASKRQIFWSSAMQGIVLCLLALLIGPLIGILAVSLLTRHFLPASEQEAFTLLFSSQTQILAMVSPYVGGTLLLALLAICLPFRRTTSMNILELRHEAARVAHRPFWLRYYLDILAAIVALGGLFVTFYLADTARGLDTATQELIIAPLTIVAPVLLLLACLLLFLRAFPAFLRIATSWTSSARGATAMLSLVQMARSPGQSLRLILLLSLATSFALFSLCFTASQNQRALDVAAYESGADFAGNLPMTFRDKEPFSVLAQYQQLPGVVAASAGYSGHATTTGVGNAQINLDVRAVDAHTFARVATWKAQYASQSLDSLMNFLSHQPAFTGNDVILPAIVDKTALSALHIEQGDVFDAEFKELGGWHVLFQASLVVDHIPTVNGSAGVLDPTSAAGVLTDYSILHAAYHLPLNYLWLRSDENPKTLAALRSILSSSTVELGLSNLLDRRAIADELQHDPLSVAVVLMLGIGGGSVFLLALLGNILVALLNIRQRRASFIVLRSLGMNKSQILKLLLWEQGTVYGTALLLACGLGLALIYLVVPALVFTGLPTQGVLSEVSASQFYLLQRILPPQIIFPATLPLALLVLALVCACTLILGILMLQRTSAAQELRLNED